MKNITAKVSNDFFTRAHVSLNKIAASRKSYIKYALKGKSAPNSQWEEAHLTIRVSWENDWKSDLELRTLDVGIYDIRYNTDTDNVCSYLSAMTEAMIDARELVRVIQRSEQYLQAQRAKYQEIREQRASARRLEAEIEAAKVQAELDIRDPVIDDDDLGSAWIRDLKKADRIHGENGELNTFVIYLQGSKFPEIWTPTYNNKGTLAFKTFYFNPERDEWQESRPYGDTFTQKELRDVFRNNRISQRSRRAFINQRDSDGDWIYTSKAIKIFMNDRIDNAALFAAA